MSNYLTHLAARSLSAVPTVQPRLPGRFEPIHPIVRGLSQELLNPTHEARDERAIAPVDLNIPVSRPNVVQSPVPHPPPSMPQPFDIPQPVMPQSAISPPTGLQSTKPPIAQQPRPTISPVIVSPASAAIPDSLSISPAASPASMVDASRSPTAPPAMTDGGSAIAPVSTATSSAPDSPSPPPPNHPPSPANQASSQILQPEQLASRSDSHPMEQHPNLPERSSPIQISPVPHHSVFPPPAPPALSSVAQLASPAIHITIGRVEVRAVTAAAPPRPTPPTSPPRPSLEDYLRERSGGQR